MTNKLLEEFVGNKFTRSFGTPIRCNHFKEYYLINSINDIEEYIKDNNEINCFCSVYSYTEYTQTNRNKFSAVIDCLIFDFDDEDNPENAINDAKKLFVWAKRHDIYPRIHYTGSKGVHIFIDIPTVSLKHPQETIRKFVIELNKNAQLKTLDYTVIGDLERLIRIPNTLHKKTMRYCIPINPTIFTLLTIKDLENMAQKKSDYVPIRQPTSIEIVDKLYEYDDIVDIEIKEMKLKIDEIKNKERNTLFPELNVGVPCLAYITCINEGVKSGYRNYAAAGIVQKCKKDGWTYNKTYRILQEFGNKCLPPLNESEIKSVLGYHFKVDYSICTFFSKFSDSCIVCQNRTF